MSAKRDIGGLLAVGVLYAGAWFWLGGGLPSGDAPARFQFLLAGQLMFLPAAVLAWEAPWRKRPDVVGTVFGAAAILAVFFAGAALVLGTRPALNALLVQTSFAAVVLAAWIGDRVALRGASSGLIPLLVGAALFLAPLGMDEYVSQARDPVAVRTAVENALALSPPFLTADSLLGFDVLKHESVYASHRLAEELVSYPPFSKGFRLHGGVALGLVALFGTVWVLFTRRRLGTPPDPGAVEESDGLC